MNKKITLYKHYDCNGTLLYVGVSEKALLRLYQHTRSATWYDQVTDVKMQRFETLAEVLQAEKESINNERPRHNITHNRFNESRDRTPNHKGQKSERIKPAVTLNREEITKYYNMRFGLEWIADFFGTDKITIKRFMEKVTA